MNTQHHPSSATLHHSLAYDQFRTRMKKAGPALGIVLMVGLIRLLAGSRTDGGVAPWQAVVLIGLIAAAFVAWFLVSRRRLDNEAAWFDEGGFHVRRRDGSVSSFELTVMERWPDVLLFVGADPANGLGLTTAWPLAGLAADGQKHGVELRTQTGDLAALDHAHPNLVLYGPTGAMVEFNSWYERSPAPVKAATVLGMVVGFALLVGVVVNVVARL